MTLPIVSAMLPAISSDLSSYLAAPGYPQGRNEAIPSFLQHTFYQRVYSSLSKHVQLGGRLVEDLGESELLHGAFSGVAGRLQRDMGRASVASLAIVLGISNFWGIDGHAALSLLILVLWTRRTEAQVHLEE